MPKYSDQPLSGERTYSRATLMRSANRWHVVLAILLSLDFAQPASSQTGTIITVAGSAAGWFSGDGGPATDARLLTPHGVAVDSVGNLFIADFPN